ncbi:protoglobin domain-containing protein [Nocardia amikacinitolerans]|uniref:protoglobin domain-containing protein n=1 Tax=Nocardia amikacinitolerans TaxID=756689 RepID=UPI0020A33BB9|nr:protoglobin domain-containing protein [Nocardia amikacinitolerans]
MSMTTPIPGYDHDDPALHRSPVTLDDLAALRESVLFGPDDEAALRTAGEVLGGQVEEILDVWYGFVGSHPHLLAYFSTPSGEPIGDYLQRVRARFGRWIIDTCTRPYDEQWLAYQQEIALRHTSEKKNQTDQADSVPHIPLRYLIAFIYPITATIRPFLAARGHDDGQVEAMYQAWFKAVTLQIALWSQPYAGSAW